MIVKEQQSGISTGQIAGIQAEAEPRNSMEPAFFSETLPAAFRLDNPLSATTVSETIKTVDDEYDPQYFSTEDLGEYEGTEYSETLARARNKSHMEAMKLDLKRKIKDEQTLNDAGGYGTLASVVAGVASPTTLLPLGTVAKGAKGAKILASAGKGALSGASAMALDEAALQAAQPFRSPINSAVAVSGGLILGGILGGGVASLSRAEFNAMARKVEEGLADETPIKPSGEFESFAKSVGAAEADSLTLKELEISGKGALTVSRASRFLNPFNRLANSPFKSARTALMKGFETTVEFNLHRDGKTLGAAAETEMKGFDAYNASSVSAIKDGFSAMKKNEKQYGRNITYQEYRERLSRALRNGDMDNEIPEISQAAQKIRKEVLEPIKQRAIDAGLLPKDVEAKFSKSYLHRRWSREKLVAYPSEAKAMLREWAGGKVGAVVKEKDKEINAVKSALKQSSSVKADTYRPAIKEIGKRVEELAARKSEYQARISNLREKIRENAAKIAERKVDKPSAKATKEGLKEFQENQKKLRAMLRDAQKAMRELNAERNKVILEKNKIVSEFRDLKAKKGVNKLASVESLEKKLAQLEYEKRMLGDAVGEGYEESITQTVDEVYATLTGIGAESVPSYISPITRPLKEKLLDIDDNVAEKFLDNDAGSVMSSYIQKMAADISLTRAFGSADMKQAFDDLSKEALEAIEKAETPKQKRALDKAYKRNVRDLEAMRDLMRGHFNKSDPDSMWAQGGIALRDLTYMSSMGGVLVSSLGDVGRHVMMQGMTRSFGDLAAHMQMPKALKEMRYEELKEAGIIIERVMASRLMTLADIHDPLARGSLLTRFTGSMSQGFSKLTLINHWNDVQKGVAAMMTQNRILKAVTGAADVVTYLRYLGMDEAQATIIAQQFKKHGAKEGQQYIAGIKQWDDTPQVRNAKIAFNAALKKEADTTVVTKGIADAPIFSNTPTGKLLFQFTGYLLGAHQRMILRGMQKADIGTLIGATMMVGMGSMVAAIKQKEYELSAEITGSPLFGAKLEDWDNKKLIYEGFDRSGLLGILGDANNRYEKLGGTGITRLLEIDETSRYSSRGKIDVFAGPALGKMFDASGAPISMLSGRAPTDSEISKARRIIPGQNLTFFRFLFDEAEGNIKE